MRGIIFVAISLEKKRIFKMFGRYQRESGYRKGFYSRSGKVGKEKMRLKLLASELGED